MKVNIEGQEIQDFLVKYLELEVLKEEIKDLKGIDWNPFDDDRDQYDGVWEEMGHNFELIWSATLAITKTVELIVVGGVSLTNRQKHKAVVQALDDAIRLPFYAEPFDGPLIDLVVKIAVRYWNSVNWNVPVPPIELRPKGALNDGSTSDVNASNDSAIGVHP
jgi:hypothetical protein